MKLPPILKQNRSKLIEICQQYDVDWLYVFGSVVTNRFNYDTSDLDFVVELEPMPPIEKGENLMNCLVERWIC